MNKSKAWHRGYWDGFARLPPTSPDAEYLLGHMTGEDKARSKRSYLPPLDLPRRRPS